MALTALITYPFDLVHSRMAADISEPGPYRFYNTTFHCFNRTNIDEGFRAGVLKGFEVCMFSHFVKAALTLPVYEVLRSKNESVDDSFQKRGEGALN
mmetsp:Transcript_13305/g.22597  ORF Transcript_13305/g.22597 Transcript_13305/m.22597 type:complete len:97 (+) Transcript_13305:478-768(+)|eukprot:CAMPEP_0168626462 /NCGR_PEP_ID=MMETSP0449_2-20121227/10648_1 /TAXON_ID=1082188 /ORGANISM="Strombidium rassoulzadegani, Strain ras09" /LENGTH=96 /DNA_ID=CAMNT_0008668465 /DNA_START=440 /DNA_END=730 /DNA_ORIENTATION=+